MLDTLLETIVYPDGGPGWHTERTAGADWVHIEEAIRRLDRCSYPFLFLGIESSFDGRHYRKWLRITGGQGEYGLSGSNGEEGRYYHYVDERRSFNYVEIWTSDQGASYDERHLCNDIEVVLRVARYFTETGQLDPSVAWEEHV
jgi:hypothetical protein